MHSSTTCCVSRSTEHNISPLHYHPIQAATAANWCGLGVATPTTLMYPHKQVALQPTQPPALQIDLQPSFKIAVLIVRSFLEAPFAYDLPLCWPLRCLPRC